MCPDIDRQGSHNDVFAGSTSRLRKTSMRAPTSVPPKAHTHMDEHERDTGYNGPHIDCVKLKVRPALVGCKEEDSPGSRLLGE